MPYQTDERLKSFLDTNQLYREQMCLAVLAIDKRFTNVQPRHPRGGPDGGRDIEATYRREQKAFGAVGFVNQANDSNEQKTRIAGKFKEDLENAIASTQNPDVFVFFTNVNLTIGEKGNMIQSAKAAGMNFCEIFDRERIRICLDSTDGLSIRYQYLQIALSEEEQASFFARWGDEIQSVISMGFRRIERSLDRLLFLQEAVDSIKYLSIQLELDRQYDGDEIGHFRVFSLLYLKEIKNNILSILFGSFDKPYRLSQPSERPVVSDQAGIKYGMGGGQWEQHVKVNSLNKDEMEKDHEESDNNEHEFVRVGDFHSIGMNTAKFMSLKYSKDSFIRFEPGLCLKDFDEATYIIMMNNSLAQKVKNIHTIANGYKIDEFAKNEFVVDNELFDPTIPAEFTSEELFDPWVRIRPANRSSAFDIRFSERTPMRLFGHRPANHSLPRQLSDTELEDG